MIETTEAGRMNMVWEAETGKESDEMRVGWINQRNQGAFHTLLLPEVSSALDRRERVTVLGLTEGEMACGALAAWAEREGSLSIRSLYVAPPYRRRGGGRMLVTTLCNLAGAVCDRVQCGYTQTLPEHEGLAPFFTAMGFQREEEEGGIYLVKVGELERFPFLQPVHEASQRVAPFSQLPLELLKETYKKTLVTGENYLEVPLTHPTVNQDVSVAVLEDRQIRSFAVLTHDTPGWVTLAWVKSAHPQDLPALIRSAFVRLRAAYPPDTVLVIRAVHPVSARLAQTIIPDVPSVSRMFVRNLVKQ